MLMESMKAFIESCLRIDFILGLLMVVLPSLYMYRKGYRVEKKAFIVFSVLMAGELTAMQVMKIDSELALFAFIVTLAVFLFMLRIKEEV